MTPAALYLDMVSIRNTGSLAPIFCNIYVCSQQRHIPKPECLVDTIDSDGTCERKIEHDSSHRQWNHIGDREGIKALGRQITLWI